MVDKESCFLYSLQRRIVAVAGGADPNQPLAVNLFGSSSVTESPCLTECLSWGGPYPGTDLWGVPKASHFDSLRDKSDRLVSCTPELSPRTRPRLLGDCLEARPLSFSPTIPLVSPLLRHWRPINTLHTKLCSPSVSKNYDLQQYKNHTWKMLIKWEKKWFLFDLQFSVSNVMRM